MPPLLQEHFFAVAFFSALTGADFFAGAFAALDAAFFTAGFADEFAFFVSFFISLLVLFDWIKSNSFKAPCKCFNGIAKFFLYLGRDKYKLRFFAI